MGLGAGFRIRGFSIIWVHVRGPHGEDDRALEESASRTRFPETPSLTCDSKTLSLSPKYPPSCGSYRRRNDPASTLAAERDEGAEGTRCRLLRTPPPRFTPTWTLQ